MACLQNFLSQIPLKSESSPAVHIFLLSIRYKYSSSFHFVRWWNLLSLSSAGDNQKVPKHQTISLTFKPNVSLLLIINLLQLTIQIVFFIRREFLLVYILLNCLLWIKLIPYFEGKCVLTENVLKWRAMENISKSEEVIVPGENCVIWTCTTSTPRKM